MVLGIIGGSSLLKSKLFDDGTGHGMKKEEIIVEVNGKKIRLFKVTKEGRTLAYFCQRHLSDPTCDYLQPGHINTINIVAALVQLNVSRVVGLGSTGSCCPDRLPVGALAVPDDYFAPFAIESAFDDYRAHVVPQFDPELRRKLIAVVQGGVAAAAAAATAVDVVANVVHEDVVYCQTAGPRFETRCEVRWLRHAVGGHLIGMTCAREATLCAERTLPYALLCTVDNLAHGVARPGDDDLSLNQFKQGVLDNQRLVDQLLLLIINEL